MSLIMSTKKFIKDITPGEKNIQLLFEVTKKITEEQEGLLCKISDETGTSDAFFVNPVKKYIQQNKVYLAKNAIACVFNQHIRIQLDKQIGTLSKQPIIIPFKDNTFDLSNKLWKKKEPPIKIVETVKQQIESKPKEQEQQQQVSSERKNGITSTRRTRLEYRHREQMEKPRYQRKLRGQQTNNNTFQKKYKYKNQPNRKVKLIDLPQEETGNVYTVVVRVRNGGYIKKSQKQFYEVDLSDETGTIIGSFLDRIQNDQNYELTNMRLRFYQYDIICLQQTKYTNVKKYNGKILINKQLIRRN